MTPIFDPEPLSGDALTTSLEEQQAAWAALGAARGEREEAEIEEAMARAYLPAELL